MQMLSSLSKALPLDIDTVFSLNQADRAAYLQWLLQFFGCTYICLWFYFPRPNQSRLHFLDGYYHEESNQTGSSTSGSLARRLFDEYRREVFFHVNGRVPGMAFANKQPYRELNESELQRMASAGVQQQFYREAKIKSAVFMGCRSGEIEMGWSNFMNQINMENTIDTNWPSSSSSSMRSLIRTASHIPEIPQETLSLQQIPSTSRSIQQVLQCMREFARTRNVYLPSQESEEAAIINAFLTVLTSPSSSTNSSKTPNLPFHYRESHRASDFKKYIACTRQAGHNLCRQSMLKRAINYCRSLNDVRREHILASHRPTSTQLHHTLSERRRRERMNETFEQLRKLLPPEAKKDKVSVLNRTRDYLTSLNAQVEELIKKNQQLEAQVQQLHPKEVAEESSESSNERLELRVTHVAESTSEEQRIIDLEVVIRGQCSFQCMVIGILQFLNQVNNVNVMSIEANTRTTESGSTSSVILRLKIEGEEWDESAFMEAVRRVGC